MDSVALAILEQESGSDLAVLCDASAKARRRLAERAPGFAEACAYELARFYGVMERAFERVCVSFENHFDKRADYHERLLQRVSLALPDIRPALVPAEAVHRVRELKGFRHLVRHAYDLTLRPERLEELTKLAELLADDFDRWAQAFVRTVRHD